MPGSVSPGQTALTRTPSGPASTASMRVSMISGRFETEYAPIGVSPHTPASEATSTIDAARLAQRGQHLPGVAERARRGSSR